MKVKKRNIIVIIFLLLLILVYAQQPPEERTVRGTVYIDNGQTQQSDLGTIIKINNTNLSITETTETYGPPNNEGRYSATINASPGDVIYVLAFNETLWGNNTGIMGQTKVDIDIILNKTRDAEPRVIILIPSNHTSYSSEDSFNVTANITLYGNNGLNCNATLSFSLPGIFALDTGETYTHDLGTINRGSSIIEVWNLTGYGIGSTNITILAECSNDGIKLEYNNYGTIVNISSQDLSPPLIQIISPGNNTRVNNPVIFYYNVSDSSPIINCTLNMNNATLNITNNPQKDVILNFTNSLTQKYNNWSIDCIDNSSTKNFGSSGLYNLTLNDYPSISNIVVDNPVDLLAGSTKLVYCNGTASDGDSYNDISNLNATLFFTGFNPGDIDNNSNHYSNSSCTLFNGAGNNIDFRCGFELEYYANNGSWYCNATVIDLINTTNSSESTSLINDLLAIGVNPNIINFGNLEIMQISPFDIIVNVTNYGNIMLDLSLYGYAIYENDNLSMDCDTNNISLEYERLSQIADQNYNSMTPINNTLNPVFVDFNLSKREGGAPESRKSIYWKLQIPLYTAGRCNGKVVFSAIKG